MTVTGTVDDRGIPEAVEFCVDWQLEAAAGAVTAIPVEATLTPPDTVLLPSDAIAASLRASANRPRGSTEIPC
jgi:hypothetical protein